MRFLKILGVIIVEKVWVIHSNRKKNCLSLYNVTEELRYRLNKSPRQRRQKLDRDFMSRIGVLTASAQFYRVVLKDIDPTGTYESIYRYLRLLRKAKADDTLIVRGKS